MDDAVGLGRAYLQGLGIVQVAAKHLSPGCRVIGVEPAAGDDATRSFKTRTLQTIAVPDTIADGARTLAIGNGGLVGALKDGMYLSDPEGAQEKIVGGLLIVLSRALEENGTLIPVNPLYELPC